MKRQSIRGFTLIEIIIFIIVLGIVASGLLVGFNQAVTNSDIPRFMPQASYLANARMEIILMNRAVNGYTSLSDPCTTTPSLAICTPLATYAAANGFTVAAPTITGANPKTITVTVTGNISVVLTTQVYNSQNN